MQSAQRVRAPTCCVAQALCKIVVLAALFWSGIAAAQTSGPQQCGDPFRNHYGPWDYRTAKRADLDIVETSHFTPRIELLGKGDRHLGDDISYTLAVFPNHHRALNAITKLADKEKTDKPQKSYHTIECWYDRAIRFRPNDTVARSLFARYLAKRKRKDEALQQLEKATEFAKDNAFSQYNIGLVYFEIGEFDRALAQAHKAMALGFERPALADLLKRENKWQDRPNDSGNP